MTGDILAAVTAMHQRIVALEDASDRQTDLLQEIKGLLVLQAEELATVRGRLLQSADDHGRAIRELAGRCGTMQCHYHREERANGSGSST